MSSTSTSLAPSSTDNDNNDSNPSFFTPGSSPPLILAFLAIGLFAAAMIAVFGWRRIQFSSTADPRADVDERLRHLGQRPKLWDLWTRKRETSSDAQAWEAIMPISAAISDSDTKPQADHRHSKGGNVSFLPLLRSRPDHGDSSSLKDVGDSESADVQVAVAVAMPSPPSTKRLSVAPSTTSGKEPEKIVDETVLLEYSLGLCSTRIPWRRDEG
ncbi:uncharacterized protein BT62DRAFT_1074300 [Guyanagaster necrorhizus]|uniref:Uncharacterized protein n=1 Tax=Guyanagaster necrorhizus TaxID=856835 RepID=A0A9P8AUZ0_9AGAR|nr:uncharacterized protein BT62DRAFT_1074300 [Guyanagaster necrorhizus MCA 3950]KAG7448760.1 hypothetical protein BT62DRAFT_1074300 [Guyanagaster necrorhizus MCA 3950]